MRVPQYIRELFVEWRAWAQTKFENIDFNEQPPFTGFYTRRVLLDVSALPANAPVEFIQGVDAATPVDGTQAFSLAGNSQNGRIIGIFGGFLNFPDVTTDRADEDETQVAKAIVGAGRLDLQVAGNLRNSTAPAKNALSGEAGYRSGAGAGSEFAREASDPAQNVAWFPTVYTVVEGQQVSLKLSGLDTAALATNALDFRLTAGLYVAVAGPGLTGNS